MSNFYGRTEECSGKLNRRYTGDKFECIVIYGRRRVGKTALINEFARTNRLFSSLPSTQPAKKTSMPFQRRFGAMNVREIESTPVFPDYDAAFAELTALTQEKRIVVVIDEYPYLAKAMPAVSQCCSI